MSSSTSAKLMKLSLIMWASEYKLELRSPAWTLLQPPSPLMKAWVFNSFGAPSCCASKILIISSNVRLLVSVISGADDRTGRDSGHAVRNGWRHGWPVRCRRLARRPQFKHHNVPVLYQGDLARLDQPHHPALMILADA